MIAALLLGACGDDEYDTKALADDLRADTGLTTEQADCMVVGLEARLGENRVGAHEEPTAEEREVLEQVAERCDVDLTG